MKKFGKNLTVGVDEQNSQYHFSQRLKPVFTHQSHSGATSDLDEDRSNKLEVGDGLNNVVQFQQFFVDDEEKKIKKSQLQSLNLSRQEGTAEVSKLSSRTKGRNKKQFTIEIAESKYVKGQTSTSVEPKQDYKEPPAPSNKKSFKARNFIFPNGCDDKIDQKNEEPEHNVQQLIKSFDRQRQEFYREKSKFQKQILVKEGQIELLQKMLTGSILKQGGHSPINLNLSHQNIQSLFLKKDLQISELCQRINELNKIISLRGEDIKQIKIENTKLMLENQTLLNKIYLLQNKELNNFTTQEFYERHRINMVPISSKTQQFNEYRKGEEFNYLTKRLQVLSQNRKQLEERNKIKSEFSYTQPPKYKETPFDGRERHTDKSRGHRF